MRKFLYAAAVAVAALVTATMMAGTASAATAVLHYADGSAVPVGTTLLGSGTAAFTSSAGGSAGVFCDTNYTATLQTNPTSPGTATESLTKQTFTSCVPKGVFCLTSVKSVTVTGLPYTTSVDSSGNVSIAGTIGTSVSVGSCLGSFTCIYAAHNASLHGVANNADNSITISNEPFDLTSGPSAVCFNPAYLSLKYAPNTDGAGNPVYVG